MDHLTICKQRKKTYELLSYSINERGTGNIKGIN